MSQSKCPRAHMVGGTCEECGWDFDRDVKQKNTQDEYATERAISKEEFQKAIFSVGIHSDIESHELHERMKRWSEKHHHLKDPEKECFYACVACSAPIHSWGMCEQCSRAWGIGHAEALNELGVTRKDLPILFAALATMVKDIHAPQDLLSEDQWKRAEQIFSHMEKMMPRRS